MRKGESRTAPDKCQPTKSSSSWTCQTAPTTMQSTAVQYRKASQARQGTSTGVCIAEEENRLSYVQVKKIRLNFVNEWLKGKRGLVPESETSCSNRYSQGPTLVCVLCKFGEWLQEKLQLEQDYRESLLLGWGCNWRPSAKRPRSSHKPNPGQGSGVSLPPVPQTNGTCGDLEKRKIQCPLGQGQKDHEYQQK